MQIKVIQDSNNRYREYSYTLTNKSSKYKGVSKLTLKDSSITYEVKFKVHKTTIYLCREKNEEYAALIYDLYAKKYIKNAQLNVSLYTELNNINLPVYLIDTIYAKLYKLEPWILRQDSSCLPRNKIKPRAF